MPKHLNEERTKQCRLGSRLCRVHVHGPSWIDNEHYLGTPERVRQTEKQIKCRQKSNWSEWSGTSRLGNEALTSVSYSQLNWSTFSSSKNKLACLFSVLCRREFEVFLSHSFFSHEKKIVQKFFSHLVDVGRKWKSRFKKKSFTLTQAGRRFHSVNETSQQQQK